MQWSSSSYLRLDETTDLHPPHVRFGAAGDPNWSPLPRSLHPAPSTDPLGQRRRPTPRPDRRNLGCATQTVRNAIRAFQAAGIDCLKQRSHRPASAHSELDGIACERLRALLHRSPRDFGEPTSLWTLELVAHVAFAQGITSRRMSGESVRQALVWMGIGWKRAKRWITSPDPAYLRKRGRATG